MPYAVNPSSASNLVNLLPTAARTSNTNGTGVDLLAYEGEIAVILDSAAGTGTSPTLDVKLQESSDNSTFTDISGATFNQVTGTVSQQKITVNRSDTKRYIRAVQTIGGTTPSFTSSVNILGWKKYVA